jgi:hypothetical protein
MYNPCSSLCAAQITLCADSRGETAVETSSDPIICDLKFCENNVIQPMAREQGRTTVKRPTAIGVNEGLWDAAVCWVNAYPHDENLEDILPVISAKPISPHLVYTLAATILLCLFVPYLYSSFPLTCVTVISNTTPLASQRSRHNVALTNADGAVGGVPERVPIG